MDWNKVDNAVNTAGRVADGAARVGRGLLGGFFLLVGIGMFIWSVFWFSNRISNLENYVLTSGTVVELEKSRDHENGGYVYSPIVSFEDQNGIQHIYNSGHASDPPSYEIGEKVELYYNSTEPEDAFLNSFFEKWVIGIALVVVGLVLVPIGTWIVISAFRRPKQISNDSYNSGNQTAGVRIG
jgi:hypothetical protein